MGGQTLRNPRALRRSGSEDWGLRAHSAPGPWGAGMGHTGVPSAAEPTEESPRAGS